MHEEHFRTLVLVYGFENRLTEKAVLRPYDAADAEDRKLLEQVLSGLGEYLDPEVDHALALRYETEAHRLTRNQHGAGQAA